MLKNIWMWFLKNVLKIQTETTEKEISDNQKYAIEYKDIDSINFNAIFSNKLANYTISDSSYSITGENARSEYFDKMGQSIWKKMKKITSMALGYGGVILVPYSKGGKLYYNIVPQNRLVINKMDGESIVSATVLAEKKTIISATNKTIYLRWTDYNIQNGNLIITQRYTNDKEQVIPVPDFWSNINETLGFSNVDRVAFGFIKSPINNRTDNDKYGVPITFGCDETIKEIKECLAQIQREYDLKQVFVGADVTMFKGDNALPTNGIYKKIDSGDDAFWEVFDPAIRDSAYYNRLQELYRRLESQVGTSAGIISKVETQNATATEIKKQMKETFDICDDMRTNIEKGMEDFFYACNVLANAYKLTPNGEYEIKYDWSYSLLEDTQSEFNQKTQAVNMGIEKKAEVRNWLHPSETMEESEKIIKEIEAEEPTAEDIINE